MEVEGEGEGEGKKVPFSPRVAALNHKLHKRPIGDLNNCNS